MMDLLERLVVAIEKLAAAAEMQTRMTVETLVKQEAPKLLTAEMIPVSPENLGEIADRESIKAELDKLGVRYADKARTPTLQALLEEWRKNTALAETAPENGEDPFAEKPAEAETVEQPMATITAVREALKNYAINNGKDKAQEILKTQGGGAAKLSDVIPALYPAILEACQAA